MGTKRLPSPSVKYTHYPPRSEGARHPMGLGSGGGGGGGGAGGWVSGSSNSSLSSDGDFGVVQKRTYYPNRNNSVQSPSPMSSAAQYLPPGPVEMGGGDRQTSWKQYQNNKQQQQQLPNGRRMAPPTSLPSRARVPGNGMSRSMGGTPLGTRELFDNQTPSSEKNWGSLGMTPGAITPSSAGLSNPVWGSTPLSTPEDPSVMIQPVQQKSQWPKEGVSKFWNQASEPDTYSSAPSRPPGLVVNSDPTTPYMKESSKMPTEGAGSFPSTPSFSSGSGTWGQDIAVKPSEKEAATFDEWQGGSKRARSRSSSTSTWGQDMAAKSSEILKSDPTCTFEEWQAGKRAPLSVFASSPWLIIRNINKQVI